MCASHALLSAFPIIYAAHYAHSAETEGVFNTQDLKDFFRDIKYAVQIT